MPSLLQTYGPPDASHAAFQAMAERFDASYRRGLWLRVKESDPLMFASIENTEAELVTIWDLAEANPYDRDKLFERFEARLAEYEELWKQAAELDAAGKEDGTA